jgi:hypothetical protein
MKARLAGAASRLTQEQSDVLRWIALVPVATAGALFAALLAWLSFALPFTRELHDAGDVIRFIPVLAPLAVGFTWVIAGCVVAPNHKRFVALALCALVLDIAIHEVATAVASQPHEILPHDTAAILLHDTEKFSDWDVFWLLLLDRTDVISGWRAIGQQTMEPQHAVALVWLGFGLGVGGLLAATFASATEIFKSERAPAPSGAGRAKLRWAACVPVAAVATGAVTLGLAFLILDRENASNLGAGLLGFAGTATFAGVASWIAPAHKVVVAASASVACFVLALWLGTDAIWWVFPNVVAAAGIVTGAVFSTSRGMSPA